MKRREFLKTAAALGAGLSGLPNGRWAHGLVADGQQTPATPQAHTSEVTLRQAAGERTLIGAAIGARSLTRAPLASLIAEQFGCLTAENEMKPISLQRIQGTFTFDQADRIVNFARDHSMLMIGHTLCWHSQAPQFLFQNNSRQALGRQAALANLRTHIDTVVRHYRGRVKGWDVVNEAINDGAQPDLRDTPARRAFWAVRNAVQVGK